jgi:hypothetical protein
VARIAPFNVRAISIPFKGSGSAAKLSAEALECMIASTLGMALNSARHLSIEALWWSTLAQLVRLDATTRTTPVSVMIQAFICKARPATGNPYGWFVPTLLTKQNGSRHRRLGELPSRKNLSNLTRRRRNESSAIFGFCFAW